MRTFSRATRWRKLGAALLALATLSGLALMPAGVLAATDIYVDTVDQEVNGDADCSLQEAIYAANRDDNKAPDPTSPGSLVTTGCAAGSGHDMIWLPPMGVFQYADPIDDADNYLGPTATPIITSGMTIEGRGARFELVAGARHARAFAVADTGYLDLREVHVKGFSISGGTGGLGGGGGGMGAGGAIYVHQGQLLVQWSTFEGNVVRGGGGHASGLQTGEGGGGGGLSGDGGDGWIFGGGGGGGARGNGGDNDIVLGVRRGGGGGGRVTSGSMETPGVPCGGAGGVDGGVFGTDGAMATCRGGGGGGGSGANLLTPGSGGLGAYGGGGGGGGGSSSGADGGFGGGGGAGHHGLLEAGEGGDGGFGGGGGAGVSPFPGGPGSGGPFGGDASESGGGGGAGLGGAIFGDLAEIQISNSTFTGNGAFRGVAFHERARDGRGAGGAIFTVGGSLTVESSTFSGNATGEYNDTDDGPVGIGGGAIVVYDPDGPNEATLLLRNTIIAGNGPFECYTRNGVDTGGSDGNIVTDSAANSQGDVPCPGVTGSDDPGLGQLQINAPGKTPTMAIGAGSPALDVAVGVVGMGIPLDDQRGILRPQGLAADIGAYEYVAPPPPPPGSAPVTTIELSPAAPNGSNGWYRTSPGIAVAATDTDGDLGETRCVVDPPAAPTAFTDLEEICVAPSVAGDGQHAVYAASNDVAGHVEAPIVSRTLKIDGTIPSLAPTLNVTTVTVGQAGVAATANATDATSGIASSSCGAVDTSTAGARSVSCTATDNAGNTATSTLDYVVEYRILGFFSPAPNSKWRAGQTVPIKVAIGDGSGTPLADAAAQALAQACWVTFSAAGVQPVTEKCLKYDPANDQFQFNWKLRKSPLGTATITVSISYPGTSTMTQLSMAITIAK
jgi:CSLREA domain-containing protein